MRPGGALRTAARLGRMTAQDAGELAAVFLQVASRQARDTLTAARGGARRSAADARRAARRVRGPR
jgi:hypothetical protein